ncbi:MAG: EAL domain-containing protein [Myxococcota bacterium]
MDERVVGDHDILKPIGNIAASFYGANRSMDDSSTQFLTSIINAITDPFFVKDDQSVYLLANEAFCTFIGVSQDELIGCTDRDLFQSALADLFLARDQMAFESRQTYTVEEQRVDALGQDRFVRTTKTVFEDQPGAPILVGIVYDLTELRRTQHELEEANRRLFELAHQDRLTSLPNRVCFDSELEEAIAEAERDNTSLSLLFMDINGFKFINDTFGHPVGDELLVEAAHRLRQVVRVGDLVARLGGDEFTIIARGANNISAQRVAERVTAVMQPPFELEAGTFDISASVGIATFPADGSTSVELVKHADLAMYRAKRVTHRPFEFFTPHLAERGHRRYLLERALRATLLESGIHIHVQPIVDISDGCVVAYEALARWDHPEYGTVSPGEFIPSALSDGDVVTVNISSQQLRDERFAHRVEAILQATGARPDQLAFEVTESIVMQDAALAILHALERLGIRLLIDDFGTGYSNLAQLKRLPFSVLKIDREFIRELPESKVDLVILKAVIAMARELGLKIVVEGVETIAQRELLYSLGVFRLQGYLFCRPGPIEQLQVRNHHRISRVA